MNRIERFMAQLAASRKPLPKLDLVADEPEHIGRATRNAKRSTPPPNRPNLTGTEDLQEVRIRLAERLRDYMREKKPDRLLLIVGNPGIGKTFAAVSFAHWAHNYTGKRVLYAGPRHQLYDDIIIASHDQDHNYGMWHESLPRQTDDDPRRHTCLYGESIGEWLRKGHDSRRFCYRICGQPYIEDGCKYYEQFRKPNPLIYGQHQHITVGHQLAKEFSLVIGDENPMSSFIDEWNIPAHLMFWNEIAFEEPMAQVLHDMHTIAPDTKHLSGLELYLALGGPQHVIEACIDYQERRRNRGNKRPMPWIETEQDAFNVGYNVLPTLIPLMLREAYAARKQLDSGYAPQLGEPFESDFIERITLHEGHLNLLARKTVSPDLPKHIVWSDATGNPDLYSALFNREVEVFSSDMALKGYITQVTDRSNNKTSLYRKQKQEDVEEDAGHTIVPTRQAEQLKAQVDFITRHHSDRTVITYKDIERFIGADTHFYSNRGTNAYQDTGVMVVAGTPMAPPEGIEKLAKCIWFERMEPFDKTWVTKEKHYNYVDADGHGWTYPVGQFADDNLNLLLWQVREAEIIQSAHRARILRRDIPVYLLTNLPIDELPVQELVDIRQLTGAPADANVYKWMQVVQFAEQKAEEQGAVSVSDFVEGLSIARNTAHKYMEALIDGGDWELAIVRKEGRGRPSKAMRKART